MKFNHKILKWSLVALLFALHACDETRLDLQPGGPTEQSFFAEEIEFERTVYGIYAKLTDLYWYNGGQDNCVQPVTLLPGDDVTTGGQDEFEIFSNIQPASFRLAYFYTACYQMIARANVLLEKNAAAAADVYKTPNLKNYHRGEALFLRAYAHYLLWNVFGTSPVVTQRVLNLDQTTPPSSTGTQLLDQAVTDLTEAANLLPATWSAENRGRVTANAANGLLGKTLVFKATVTKNNADYQAALTAFSKIQGASLVAKFDDNFAFDTENNSESLFEFQASQAFGFDNVWLSNDFDNAVGALSVFWGYYSNQFNLFGKAPFIATQKLVDAFERGDPRRNLTLNDSTKAIRKYVTRDKVNQPGASSVNNPRILRLADVLLLRAEALNESGGSKSEAIALLNQVRTRARNMVSGGTVPADFPTSETNQATIRQWIQDERLRELAAEGQRWFDLRRWALGGQIMLSNAFFNSALPNAIQFDPNKHLYFPIPTRETDVNPNIKQNPGY
jgi:hypothetical protein